MKAGVRLGLLSSYFERYWALLSAIALLFAFGLRVGVILHGEPTSPGDNNSSLEHYSYVAPRLSFTQGDASNYDQMARNFLAGRGLVYGEHYEHKASRPPLYPLFLALLYAVFGRSALTVGLAHVLLGVGTCGIVGLVGKRYFGASVGLLAMIAVAAEPQLLKFTGRVYSETLMVFLVSLMVVAHLWAAHRRSIWPAVVAGLSIGVAALCRQTVLPFVLFGGIWLGFQWSHKSFPVARNLVAYALMIPLTMMPYMLRNYVLEGATVPLTTKAGGTLWLNNNPLAKTVWEDPPREEVNHPGMGIPDVGRAKRLTSDSSTDAIERYHQYQNSVVSFVLANPGRYLVLAVSRGMFLWNLWPTTPPSLKFFLAFWTMLAVAILGIILTWKKNQLTPLLALLIICYTLVHAATYAIPRYRVPTMPWVMLLASAGFVVIAKALLTRRADGRCDSDASSQTEETSPEVA